jgi:carbon monoxide dehydrogenase subunit G
MRPLVSVAVMPTAAIPTLARFAAIALMLFPALAAAQDIDFDVSRAGDVISVNASAEIRTDPGTAWKVLTDYDHLADFIPDMKSSRVILRNADGVLVEQKGAIDFLFFSQPVDVTLAVVEQPQKRIVARGVSGNLTDLEARYELEPTATGVSLRYSGRFVPGFSVPPLIGMSVVRSVLRRRFTAMVDEIVRRDALARSKPQP